MARAPDDVVDAAAGADVDALSSVGSNDSDDASSASWAGDEPSGADDNEMSSSDDDGALGEPRAVPRPKIKLRRGRADDVRRTEHTLEAGDQEESQGESQGETDARSTPSTSVLHPAAPQADALAGAKRKRPIKQLRRKSLNVALSSLVAALKRRDQYQFFHEPVNVDEVPGYTDIIPHPMDLGTMEQRIEEKYYTSVDMFRDDFLLVTRNAREFNPPSSIYHTAAKRLEDWGRRAIEREGLSIVDDTLASDTGTPPGPARRARVRRKAAPLDRAASLGTGTDADEAPRDRAFLHDAGSRRTQRIGSARSTTWSPAPEGTPGSPALAMLRRTLMYAGVSQNQLTGKSACAAKLQAKPKARLGPVFLPAEPAAAAADADEAAARTYTYADDGSLDAAEIANLPEFLAQYAGAGALVLPAVESLRHLPMLLASSGGSAAGGSGAAGEPGFVFPTPNPGRPDVLLAATHAGAAAPPENWDHMLQAAAVPADQRVLPFAVAATPAPSGLAPPGAPAPLTLSAAWPVPPPPPIQDPLQSGLRLNRRERELEQERDEHNWTFFRPHLTRLLEPTDLGPFASMPAWIAATDRHALRPYGVVAAQLSATLHEHLRSMPYRALGLPRTAQYVPRSSLGQLPLGLQMSMQGAQETERLVDVVYGSPQGLAWVRSLAEFCAGAAGGEGTGEKVASGGQRIVASGQQKGEGAVKEETCAAEAVAGEVLAEEEKPMNVAAMEPSPRRTPHSTSAAPRVLVQAEGTRSRSAARAPLPCSLVDYVKWQVANPATGGLLGLLSHVGERISRMPLDVAPSPGLGTLLDDPDSTVARALEAVLCGAQQGAQPLAQVLEEALGVPRRV
ncbi:pre-mRNA-splicing factor prp46 [Malassezia sp. CBS 17886]|nr:pre-mRNA-splicing factor prp46 [Malassezia sp. CBS 17886]